MEDIKVRKILTIIIVVLVIIACFAGGIFIGKEYFSKTVTVHEGKTDKPGAINVQGNTESNVRTEIVYVPKETKEIVYVDSRTGEEGTRVGDVDIDAQIGKQDVLVKVNDKVVKVDKKDDEKYVFDKNKLSLTQTSRAEFNVHVDPVDNTRYWEVGVGVNDKGKAAFTLDVPLNKKNHVGLWGYRDHDRTAVGLKVKF